MITTTLLLHTLRALIRHVEEHAELQAAFAPGVFEAMRNHLAKLEHGFVGTDYNGPYGIFTRCSAIFACNQSIESQISARIATETIRAFLPVRPAPKQEPPF